MSGDSFHNLARRFAAKVIQPGTGSLALQLFMDRVETPPLGLATLFGNKSDPRGSIHCLDFHIVVAEV